MKNLDLQEKNWTVYKLDTKRRKGNTPTESAESISKTRGTGCCKESKKPMKTGKTTK